MDAQEGAAFSPEEFAALRNTQFFRLKASASARLRASFEALRAAIRPELPQTGWLCHAHVDVQNGFITTGEDYLGLPYVVMDFPKHYSRDEKLAMRTLFWWGHYVVYSLILEGPWLFDAKSRLIARLGVLSGAEVHATMAATPWDWRHGMEYTRPILDDAQTQAWLAGRPFLKLMRFLPILDPGFTPDGIVAAGQESWRVFAPLVCDVGGPRP